MFTDGSSKDSLPIQNTGDRQPLMSQFCLYLTTVVRCANVVKCFYRVFHQFNCQQYLKYVPVHASKETTRWHLASNA